MTYLSQPQDASMEDILSSIRKILDDETSLQKSVATKSSETLELTEIVKEIKEISPVEDVRILSSKEHKQETFSKACADIPLMSHSTLSASMAALSSLKEALTPHPHLNGNTTLDEMAKTLLLPLLKDWVDRNLPSLVEQVVREEIQKITQRLS